ncbi:DM13 domain-containing protein [Promicromonospora sp. NFX87]|uniref:DM13 domain-containing protein n=1 Tax=Promicromonospora sp. NFX87 TaxID=3402691 RepID=UPI003AFB6234
MRKTVFRRSVFAGTTILALSLALAACGSEETPGGSTAEETAASQTEESPTDDETTDDEMTAEARSGAFEGLNDKSVEGSVEVSATEIVLSEFSSDEGPDLHVYLTNGSEAADVAAGVLIDVVAFDEASQTFTLDGVDVAGYDTVVINCDKAKAVFGAAPLA